MARGGQGAQPEGGVSAGASDWGVYIHFPWCARVCPYCDFNVYRATDVPHVAYADAVLAQWDQARGQFPPWAPATVFFGGGTPPLPCGTRLRSGGSCGGWAQPR